MRAMVAGRGARINGPDDPPTTNYKSMTIGAIDRRGSFDKIAKSMEMEGSPPPPPRLRDIVAKPRPAPVRTLVLVALVPLVAVTIYVIATHRDPRATPAPAKSPSAQPSGVIFVVPVSAPPAKSAE
jgi:hypothetical protein